MSYQLLNMHKISSRLKVFAEYLKTYWKNEFMSNTQSLSRTFYPNAWDVQDIPFKYFCSCLKLTKHLSSTFFLNNIRCQICIQAFSGISEIPSQLLWGVLFAGTLTTQLRDFVRCHFSISIARLCLLSP